MNAFLAVLFLILSFYVPVEKARWDVLTLPFATIRNVERHNRVIPNKPFLFPREMVELVTYDDGLLPFGSTSPVTIHDDEELPIFYWSLAAHEEIEEYIHDDDARVLSFGTASANEDLLMTNSTRLSECIDEILKDIDWTTTASEKSTRVADGEEQEEPSFTGEVEIFWNEKVERARLVIICACCLIFCTHWIIFGSSESRSRRERSKPTRPLCEIAFEYGKRFCERFGERFNEHSRNLVLITWDYGETYCLRFFEPSMNILAATRKHLRKDIIRDFVRDFVRGCAQCSSSTPLSLPRSRPSSVGSSNPSAGTEPDMDDEKEMILIMKLREDLEFAKNMYANCPLVQHLRNKYPELMKDFAG